MFLIFRNSRSFRFLICEYSLFIFLILKYLFRSEAFHSLVRELLALLFALLHSQAADVIGVAAAGSIGLEISSAPSTPGPSVTAAATDSCRRRRRRRSCSA